jgi:hypothetical protein
MEATEYKNICLSKCSRRENVPRGLFAGLITILLAPGLMHAQDTAPPELMDVRFAPSNVDVGLSAQTVIVDMHITDNLSGFASGWMKLSSPGGQSVTETFLATSITSGSIQDGVFRISQTIPQFSEPGSWCIDSMYIKDAANNITNPELTALPCLEVASSAPDTAPPELMDVSFAPSTVDVGLSAQTVTVDMHITDNLSGFASGWMKLSSPGGQSVTETFLATSITSGSIQDGVFRISHTIPQFSEPGSWCIDSMYIKDAANNIINPELTALPCLEVVASPPDTTLPIITGLPENIVTTTDPALATAVVSWAEPEANDNLGVVFFGSSHLSGSAFPVGKTTVTYTASDAAGNATMASFLVMVADLEAPVISGIPDNIETGTHLGLPTAVVSWTSPIATDNVAVETFETTHQPGGVFPVGETTVTYIASDAAENFASASFTVTIVDQEAPVFSDLPSRIQVATSSGATTAPVIWSEPAAIDNVELAVVTRSHVPGATFPLGATTVTYTATDTAGNSTTASFTVVVVDSEAPIITGTPQPIVLPAELGKAAAVATWNPPQASDNVGVATFQGTHTSGSPFPVGESTVSYTAADAAGNVTTVSFTVTVVDEQVPAITRIPDDITQANDAGKANAAVGWAIPEATDNVGVESFLPSKAPGSTFPLGVTTVTYTALDAAGNQTTASFTVTVRDAEGPVISGLPDDIVQATDAGMSAAVVTWAAPTVTDNVAVAATDSDHAPGGSFPLGTTTVTYRAEDEAGNESMASFTVTVVDREKPVFSGVPVDLTLPTDIGKATVIATWTAPTAADNVGVVNLVSSHYPGVEFPVGASQVTYMATDAAGNKALATFTVTVADGEAPVIADMPKDIVVASDAGAASTAVEWTPPTASDNVGVVSLSPTQAPGSAFSVGITTVTYTARDAAANEAFATFTVTVEDGEPPVITGVPGAITQATDYGKPTATVTWSKPVVTDNVEEPITITTSHRPGDVFPLGVSTVTYTATDGAGNKVSASFMVMVTDEESPVISGVPANLTLSNETGKATTVATWSVPTATDNVAVTEFIGSHAPGAEFTVGETTITYSASDTAGNTTTASFLITVVDDETPVLTGVPTDIVTATDPGKSTAVVTWEPPTASDNVAVTVLESSHVPGSLFAEGSRITVTYTAVDAAGNVTTASFTVAVLKFDGAAGFRDWLIAEGDDPTTAPDADLNRDGFSNTYHYLFDVPLTSLIKSDPRDLVPSVNPGLLPNRAAFVVKVPAVLPQGVAVALDGTEDGATWEMLAKRASGEQSWQFSLPVLLETSPPVEGLETVAVGLGSTYRQAPVGLFRLRVILDSE